MSNNLQYLNERIYTPILHGAIADNTGMRFQSMEEDACARQIIDQVGRAGQLRKQASVNTSLQQRDHLQNAVMTHMSKIAAYASGRAVPEGAAVFQHLHQMIQQDPRLAAALDELDINN